MKSQTDMYTDAQELINSNQDRAAMGILDELLTQYPDFSPAHIDLGHLNHKMSNREEARDHFERAVGLEEDNPEYLKLLADYYYVELKDNNTALATYKKLLKIKPNDVDSLTIAGNLCLSDHQWDEAEHYYKRILEIEPWRFEIEEYLEKLTARGDKSDTGKNPDVETLYTASQKRVEAGDLPGAVEYLKKIIDIDSSNALAYNDLGVIYYRMGDKEKAFEHYQTAAEQMPHNHIFLKNIADFYCHEQGNLQEALPIYMKILSEEPTDIEILMTMGIINIHLNRIDDAKIFFDRVLDIEPWNIEANEQLEKLT